MTNLQRFALALHDRGEHPSMSAAMLRGMEIALSYPDWAAVIVAEVTANDTPEQAAAITRAKAKLVADVPLEVAP